MVNSRELTKEEDSEDQNGVILGYWDQEKTPTVIQDLEQSVNLVEKKCKKLLQELLYYKKYLEESQRFVFNFSKLKGKRNDSEKSPGFSGSDPDIKFRKNLLYSEEFKEAFEENFKAKLLGVNKDLTNAAKKIGQRDNIILFSNEDSPNSLRALTEEDIERCWSQVREEFIRENYLQAKAKSDSKISDNIEFSRITLNELELYQKLSKLSCNRNKGRRPTRRMKISPIGRKTKAKLALRFQKRKTRVRAREDMRKVSVTRERSKKIKELDSKSLKNKKNKLTGPVKSRKRKSGRSHSPRFHDPRSLFSSRRKLRINDAEIETMCNSLEEAIHQRNPEQVMDKTTWKEKAANLLNSSPFTKRAIPFTAGTSTSKSYNIGMNIQQYLSLAKYRKLSGTRSQMAHKKASPESSGPQSKELIQNGAMRSSSLNSRQLLSWQDGARNDGFQVSQVEHKEKVWISNRCTSSDFRKVRSKYTGSSPNSFMGYHKSTTRQYTNGQKSVIKSESKTAYAVGSKIMVSDCRRTDFFEIDKDDGFLQNASGDGTSNISCSKLKMEWSKVFGSFLEVYRKYTELKEQVSNKDFSPSDGELQSLEKEIDFAIDKYKEFLKLYSKFLQLKHRLKTLKIACEEDILGPVTSFSLDSQKRISGLDTHRPTYSMLMKKAFKQVQELQEKIRLVHDV